MATFTGTSTAFNSSNRVLHDGSASFISNAIGCHLLLEANPPLITNERLSDLTPMSGGGYPGLVTLGTKSIDLVSGKNWKFDAADIDFVAGAGGIVNAYYWVLFENDSVDKWLLSFGQLDVTNNPVSAAQGDSILIQPHATNGFYLFATTN